MNFGLLIISLLIGLFWFGIACIFFEVWTAGTIGTITFGLLYVIFMLLIRASQRESVQHSNRRP